MSRLYLWFALCTFFCTGTAGASRHPAFPVPSQCDEGSSDEKLGRCAPRERGVLSFSAVMPATGSRLR